MSISELLPLKMTLRLQQLIKSDFQVIHWLGMIVLIVLRQAEVQPGENILSLLRQGHQRTSYIKERMTGYMQELMEKRWV